MTIYRVVSVKSGKVLDVAGGSLINGANIQQWDWWGGPNQKWSFDHLGNISGRDVYSIICQASFKALDLTVAGNVLDNGVNVQQWDWWGAANQLWYLIPVGDGSNKIQSVLSWKVLDVTGQSMDNGANIQVWDDWNGPNQHWRLEEV